MSILAEAVPAPTPKPEWLTRDVLLIRDLMHPVAVAQFVEDATKAPGWEPATVHRLGAGSATIIQVDGIPRVLGTWRAAVDAVLKYTLGVYCADNKHFENLLRRDQGAALLRFGCGAKYAEHIDSAPGHPTRDIAMRLAAFHLYLGDDYDGGELCLPRQGLVIKPSIGSVVMFPTGFPFPHESREITRGQKDVVVTWLQ